MSIKGMNKNLEILLIILILGIIIIGYASISGIASESNQEKLSIEKIYYSTGEDVFIHVLGPIEGKELFIIHGDQVYRYAGNVRTVTVFKPKVPGNYTVKLLDKEDGTITASNFYVVDIASDEGGEQEVEIELDESDNLSNDVISIDKISYNLGEGVYIRLNVNVSSLVIWFGNNSLHYLGEFNEKIVFIPKQVGEYKVVITLEDNSVIEKIFWVVFKEEPVEPQINVSEELKQALKLIKRDGEFIDYNINSIEDVGGFVNVELGFESNIVKSISFDGLLIEEEGINLKIDEVQKDIPELRGKGVQRIYAIDPTELNFSRAVVTAVAEGNELYKCKDWNFEEQICEGTWEKLMDIVPGQEYSFVLTPDDPGYAETDITIIDVQSYPTVGGNWEVRFNTTGMADLTITVFNGTTWSNVNEDNDLKFLETRCGNNVLEYEWINNSVFISNYSCDETGYEISKVLTCGKHTLEFKFGNDTKYAYNEAGLCGGTPSNCSNHNNQNDCLACGCAWVLVNTTMVNESFEGATFPPTNWEIDDTQWSRSNARASNGSWSARFDGSGGGINTWLMTPTGDYSDADAIYIDFYYYESVNSDSEFTIDYLNSSSSWNEQSTLNDGGTWGHYTDTITDSQYFYNGFRIEWDNDDIEAGDYGHVDGVLIIKRVYQCSGTPSSCGSHSGQTNCTLCGCSWDSAPNVTSLNYPSNGANITSTSVNFNFTATDDHTIQNCSLYMNISGWTIQGTAFNVTNNTNTNITVNPSDGKYIWNIRCWDNATVPNDDWYSTNYTITIDRTGPTTTLDRPQNFTNISTATYTVNASATDALSNVDTVSFYYRKNSTASWGFICSDNSGPMYECTWNMVGLSSGNSYQVRAFANDTIGNIGNNNTHTNITVEVLPTISNTSCYKAGVGWVNCTTIAFGDTLDSVRTNCTSNSGGSISNVSFMLKNVDDNKVYFNATLTNESGSELNLYANSYGGDWANSPEEADNQPDSAVAWDETDNGNELYTHNFVGLPEAGTINKVYLALRSNFSNPAIGNDELTLKYSLDGGTTWKNLDGTAYNGASVANQSGSLRNDYYQITGSLSWSDLSNIYLGVEGMQVGLPDDEVASIDAIWLRVNYSSEYWEYDVSDMTIYDSGLFNLHITCRENPVMEEDINWSIPYGNLSAQLISPSTHVNVTRNRFFNFTARVTCSGGECGDVNATLDPTNWWNSNWDYRMQINITENSGSAVSNWTTNVSIDTQTLVSAGKMNADMSDLRIIENGTEIAYHIEPNTNNTANTIIHFKTDLSASQKKDTVFLYYGNSGASTPTYDYNLVYMYWDDFNRTDKPDITTEANYSSVGGATWNITNNKLVASGGSGDPNKLLIDYLGSSPSFTNGVIVVKMQITQWTDGDAYRFGPSLRMDGSGGAGRGYCSLLHNNDGASGELDLLNDGVSWFQEGSYAWNQNTWYYHKFMIIGQNTWNKVWLAITAEPSSWNYANVASGGSRNSGYYGLTASNTNTGTPKAEYDDLRVYKAMSSAPSYTLGSEENNSGKGVVPLNSGTPFYTTSDNPMNSSYRYCLANMTDGNNCDTTWQVNATGSANTTWEFFVTYASMNYSANVSAVNTSAVNITIINNIAPTVDSVSIDPLLPSPSDDLNCTFTVSDSSALDTLTANVSWYKGSALSYSEVVSVTSGVKTNAILNSGNTSSGEYWHCGVTPYDQIEYGTQVNSSAIQILASQPPVVNQIWCYEDGSTWTQCENILYGDSLKAVRADCTDPDGYVVNATFTLINVEDSYTFFNNYTNDNSTGYFVFNNTDITITDSGTFNLSVTCYDNSSTSGSGSSNWTVPWGSLVVELINPNEDINVTQNKFFNFTARVNCTGGECGYVSATLDPENWWNTSWDYRRKINLTEKSNNILTDYQFNVTLNTQSLISAGKMRSDCGDVRFVDSSNNELDYWVEYGCNTSSTLIWVEYSLSAYGNASIYVYYGNSTAQSQSNGTETLFLYEDMSGPPSGSLTGSAAYVDSTVGVRLTPVANDQLGYLYWLKNPGPGFYGRYETWAGGGTGADSTWIGVHDTSVSSGREDIVNDGYHFTVDEWTDPDERVAFTKSTTDNGPSIAEWNPVAALDDSQWHNLSVYFYNNGTRANALIYYDGVLRVNGTDSSPQSTAGNYFFLGGRTGGSTNEHRVRTIEIRKYVYPQPTVELEQEIPQNKGIIPMNSGDPFYTVTANPMFYQNNSCLANMKSGSSCNTTWQVNATGLTGIPWEFFVTYDAENYSSYVSSATTSRINITIIQNVLPNVSYILLTPLYPLPEEDLYCNFTIIDANYFDTLSANISWYNSSVLIYSQLMNVSNGVQTYSILSSENTSLGETWWCGVIPFDNDGHGSQVNSSNVTIVATKPPEINEIQCQINNGSWGACSGLSFNDSLTAIRVNCTSDYFTVVNVTVNLTNIPDSNLFYTNTTFTNNSDWWIINKTTKINDSGEFRIDALCMDNESSIDIDYTNWTIPWGTLVVSLVDPDGDISVEKDEFFSFTAQVSCVGGECGDVEAILDPHQYPISMQKSYSPITEPVYEKRVEDIVGDVIINDVQTNKKVGNSRYPNGLITLNSKKPIYRLGESAELISIVLDKKGEFVSNENLQLTITKPDGTKERVYSSQFKELRPGLYEFVYGPLQIEGVYGLEITTINSSVKDVLYTLFEVKEDYVFDIIRETPIAIDPWESDFESTIHINSLEGTNQYSFVETIPSEWEIIEANNAYVWYSDKETQIIWSDLRGNSTVSYQAKIPKISPNRYKLESYILHDGQFFEEARPWLVAVDPLNYYSAYTDSLSTYSDGTYTQADAGDYSDTLVADCTGGTCTSSNSWETGFQNLTNAEPYDCELNATLSFNVSDLNPEYLKNVTITWGGCWHGDEVLTSNNCDNGDNPEFDDGTGGGSFDMWILGPDGYEKLDCVSTVGSECGAGSEINLGTDASAPGWGDADDYNTFRYRKTINSSYADDNIITIKWRVFGTSVCGDTDADDDIIMIIDYANLTVGWEYLIKSGMVSTINGTEPFYTIDSNPQNKSDDSCLGGMVDGRSCQITWDVNATGGIGTTHEFYVIFNSTQYPIYVGHNETDHIYITIEDTSSVPPVVTLVSPNNNSATNNPSVVFNCSATDNNGLFNMTLYANFNGTFRANGTNNIGGTSNSTTFTRTLQEGIYIWNCLAYDDDDNYDWGNTNRTLTVDTTKPSINLAAPDENSTFYVGTILFNFTVFDNLDSVLICNITIDSTVEDANFSSNNASLTSRPIGSLEQGNHSWNVACVDNAGNFNTSKTINFSIIDLPPNVTLVTPDNYSQNSTSIDLQYNATDNNDVTKADLYINSVWNDSSSEVGNGEISTFTVGNLVEGRYNWTVNVTDISNLTVQATERWFFIDFTKPSIVLYAPEDNHSTNQSTIYFNFTVTDNLDADKILVCNITINGGVYDENFNANNGSLTSRPINNIPDGVSYWNITCVDDAGNWNTSETRSINVSSPPSVELNSPEDNHSQSLGDITLYYTPTDNTGFNNCDLILDNEINQTNSSINNGYQNNFTLIGLNPGFYNWTVNCTDLSGLSTLASPVRRFVIDSTEPTITLHSPLPNASVFGPLIKFNFTVTDDVSNLLYCNLTLDGEVNESNIPAINGSVINQTITINLDGVYWWNLTCWDDAYNTNTSETRNFTIYNPPYIALVSPDNGTILDYRENVNFTYIPVDADGLGNASLIINNVKTENDTSLENGEKNSFLFNFSEDGLYYWTINATDIYELEGTGSPQRQLIIDTTSPNITIITPYNNETVTWNNVTFSFSVTDNLDDELICNITVVDSVEWENVSVSNGSTVTRYSELYDGNYNWSVTCIDHANNTNSYILINFTVEAPPNVTLNFPIDNYRTTSQDMTFNYTPYDYFGFNNCSLYINGVFNNSDSSIERNEPNYFDLTNISDGYYNWSVECIDEAPDLNPYTAPYENFTIDTLGPSIVLNYPGEGQAINYNNITFNWTPTDAPGINITCNLTIDSAVNVTNITNTSGTNFLVEVNGLADGAHNWSVSCVDDLGNSNTSFTGNFTINQPDLFINNSMISFNNSNPDLNENITIFANVSNIGGIDASNVLVEFWDGLPGSGTFIGNNTKDVGYNATVTFNISWIITAGYHTIWVVVDPDDNIAELNESNNNATTNISVLISTINSPQNDSWQDNETVEINFTLQDFTNGSINYSIFVDGILNGQNGSASDNVSKLLNVTLSEGVHYIIVQATDNLSRSKNSTSLKVNIDLSNPSPIFETANQTWFNDTTPEILFNITDNLDDILNYTLYVNGSHEANGSVNNGTTTSINLSSKTDGVYELVLEASDEAGHVVNSTPIIIYIDTTKPSINLTYPPQGVNTTSTTIELNFSVSDNLDSELICNLTLNGDVYRQNIVAYVDTEINTTISGLNETTYYWNVTCVDNATNWNISETRSFNVYLAPVVELIVPAHDTWNNSENITFYFNVSDDTGIENCSLIFNGQINDTRNSSEITNNAVNNFTVYDIKSGYYNWSVNCTDNTSLYVEGNSTTWLLKVDRIKPFINLTLPVNGYNSSSLTLDLNFSVIDNMDDEMRCNLTVNGSVYRENFAAANNSEINTTYTATGEGTYYWNVTCWDNASNINTSETRSFNVVIPPIVILDSPPDNSWSNAENQTFYFNVSDDTGINNCSLILNGLVNVTKNSSEVTNNAKNNFTVYNIKSNLYNWSVECYDDFNTRGNSTTWRLNLDRILPSINLTWPQESYNSTSFTLDLNFTVIDNMDDELRCNLTVNGSVYRENFVADNNTEIKTTYTGSVEGSYYWNVSCWDNASNINTSETRTFNLAVPPNVTLVNPPNGSWSNAENQTFYFIVNDTTGIRNCSLILNGVINDTKNSSEIINNAMNNFSVVNIATKFYNWSVNCTDVFGAEGNSSTWLLRVDKINPSINLVYPSNGLNYTNTIIDLNFTVTDNMDNEMRCNLTLNNGVIRENFAANNGSEINTTVSWLNETTYYWNVSCWDNATNINTSETKHFFVYIAPNITLVSPADNNWTNVENQTFYFNVSDDTGIENCSLLLDGQINDTKNNTEIINNAMNNFTVYYLNGSYSWAVECYDNTSQHMYTITSNRTLYVDIIAPYPYIETANGTWFNTTTPTIYFNITDNLDQVLNYTFYVDGVKNVNGTATNGSTNSTNLVGVGEGSHEIILEAFDNVNNIRNSTPITIYVDITKPSINLTYPEEGHNSSSTSVELNFTVIDNLDDNLTCNLTIDGSVYRANFSALNNTEVSTIATDQGPGWHYWNVTCWDNAGNWNTSETRSYFIEVPDLTLNNSDIVFNQTSFSEGQNVTINATIYNIGNGDAANITVQFFEGYPGSDNQINGNKTINSLPLGTNATVNTTYIVKMGSTNIYVVVDPPLATNGSIVEANESNNLAYNIIIVGSYEIVIGNITGLLQLYDTTNMSLFDWNVSNYTNSNIYVVDSDSIVKWDSLQAVSRDTINGLQMDDFDEADTAMNMTQNPDSINTTWTENGGVRLSMGWVAYGNTINNVAIVNSTNTSNFVTGILWDYNDPNNGEYNGTQDVVFITKVNENKTGMYGVYDFEIRVPAMLRGYIQPNTQNSVTFYVEIK